MAWTDVSTGLPSGFVVNNLVPRGRDAFAAVKSPAGVYQFDAATSSWSQYASAVNKYGIGSLVVGPDSKLYCLHQGMLHVLNEAPTPKTWVRLASPLKNAVVLAAGSSGSNKLYLSANGTTNPVLLEFDVSSGATTNLQFPFTGLDGEALAAT